MTDRDRYEQSRQEREARASSRDEGRSSDAGDSQGERRSWESDRDDAPYLGRGGNTPYGRASTGSADRSEGYGRSGGYGDQGGFGSQHGQGGYASPAQGSAYGQTGSEWGRSGYGGSDNRGGRSDRRYGGGETGGFGYTSFAAERDAGDAGRTDGNRSAQRSQARTRQNAGEGGRDLSYEADYRDYGGDDRARAGAAGGYAADDDHEPHYRRWRDQQLESHDRDYNRWRTEQTKRYDDEYKSYRDTRHQSFSKDFGDWRSKDRKDEAPAASPLGAQSNPYAAETAEADRPSGFGTADGSALSGDPALQNVAGGGGRAKDDDKKS